MANKESKVPPSWVQDWVVKERKGLGLRYIMGKTITESDLNKLQNRLLIPKEDVEDIKVMLSEEEMIMANLHPAVAVDHEGLDIRVFPQNKFRVEDVKLKCWRSTGSTVINGKEMNVFRAWSGLRVKDQIEMWGFRDRKDGKLCFAISKTGKKK